MTTANLFPQSTNEYDPIASLIDQAMRLYETDEPRRGHHYLILMELHALDFARRRFGPRAFDGQYKPTSEARHDA